MEEYQSVVGELSKPALSLSQFSKLTPSQADSLEKRTETLNAKKESLVQSGALIEQEKYNAKLAESKQNALRNVTYDLIPLLSVCGAGFIHFATRKKNYKL